MYKICYKCNTVKPLDGFNRCTSAPDQRQTMCRQCFSAYNRARYLEKVG